MENNKKDCAQAQSFQAVGKAMLFIHVFAEGKLRISRTVSLSFRGKRNGSYTPKRKATRGSVLWTPRRNRESIGKTRVAANAVSRGCWPRFSLPLCDTPDKERTTHEAAARRFTTQAAARAKRSHSANGGAKERIGPCQRSFLSYTGRGAVFLFGQVPKRKIGGRMKQVPAGEKESIAFSTH